MTMIFQFFVFTCACALGAAGVVPTPENLSSILKTIEKAIEILRGNVLSMDGNVPALDDSRRHYAAIVYVVSREATAECSGIGHDYYRDYQKNINKSLTYADANPQEVIQKTQKVVDDVLKAIKKDELEIILAAGLTATQLIENDKDSFAPISQNLTSHNFVITGAEKLKKIVAALENLYKRLYGPLCGPH